jgi:hypothetical protein
MSRKSKVFSRLNAIFADMGMPTVDENATLSDAKLIAEAEGYQPPRPAFQEFNQCNGKNCYPTYRDAQIMVRSRQTKGWNGLRIYHCPDCKTYHLTSQ